MPARPRLHCGLLTASSSSSLSLAASLYANQLSANLLLLQTAVQALSTRVLLQNALQRFNAGNNTDENWSRAAQDLQNAMGGTASSAILQAQVFPKNDTGFVGRSSVLNVTGQSICRMIPLPYLAPNGSSVYLGQNGSGYPSNLYPNLTYSSTPLNSTFNISNASYNGLPLRSDSVFFLGPWLINETFALVSLTLPIVNTSAPADTLGFLTIVASAAAIMDIGTSTEGLGNTGEILIVKPNTANQKLPSNLRRRGSTPLDRTAAGRQEVVFVVPPVYNTSRNSRHMDRVYGTPNAPFTMDQYPAVLDAYASGGSGSNGAGSLISTHDEQNSHVSVGYALVTSRLADWALVVEQSYDEVTAPIRRLRAILLACVFGTVGVLLILLFPIAHLSVRPIRRLREATSRAVETEIYPSEDGSSGSLHPSQDGGEDSGEDGNNGVLARKEGFIGRVTQRHGRNNVSHTSRGSGHLDTFRIPGKVVDPKHVVHDELTDLTRTYNEMSDELTK